MTIEVKNRLKVILDERGIKRDWMADKVGISYKTLSNLTQNKYNTSLAVALKIAYILKLPVDKIFYMEKVKGEE